MNASTHNKKIAPCCRFLNTSRMRFRSTFPHFFFFGHSPGSMRFKHKQLIFAFPFIHCVRSLSMSLSYSISMLAHCSLQWKCGFFVCLQVCLTHSYAPQPFGAQFKMQHMLTNVWAFSALVIVLIGRTAIVLICNISHRWMNGGTDSTSTSYLQICMMHGARYIFCCILRLTITFVAFKWCGSVNLVDSPTMC